MDWKATLRGLIAAIIPLRRALRARHRDFVCAREMKQLMRDPQSSRSVLSDLIYGLGERRMVRQSRISEAFLIYATRAGGQILECGSGLTTLLVGVVAQRTGYSAWSLQHLPQWVSAFKTIRTSIEFAALAARRPLRGWVPLMQHKLKTGCVILLDDADREQERAIAQGGP